MARRNLFGTHAAKKVEEIVLSSDGDSSPKVEEIVLSSDGDSSPKVVGLRFSFAKQIREEEAKRVELKKKLKELKEKEGELYRDRKYLTAKVRLERRNMEDNRDRFLKTEEEKDALEKKLAKLEKKHKEMDQYKERYEEELLVQMKKVFTEALEKAKGPGQK